MSPRMIENLFEPALACEFLGADFVLMIDVVLLALQLVVGTLKSGSSRMAPRMATMRIVCRSG